MMNIDAQGMHYKELNERVRQSAFKGIQEIILHNVNGQRYLGDCLSGDIRIKIQGTPGNDMAAFMDGPIIEVFGNVQDGAGNTMNAGKIIVHGHGGDIVGHSMRGGKIFIRADVGYSVGIHMKAYENLHPVIIIGGCAEDFLGEYMAGGVVIVLGLHNSGNRPIVGNYCGTGMHGGSIYIRGEVHDFQLGKEVKLFEVNEEDQKNLRMYVSEYAKDFSLDLDEIFKKPFYKLIPFSHRPYGKLYAY